jgi:murein DD-endopeptidase MepM/ murein hydrolase activator NlpD
VFAHAQTDEERYAELQRRYQELEQQAARIREDLTATQQEKQSLQKEVNSIRGQINYMESKIQATDARIGLTNVEIGGIEERISETQKSMDEKRGAIGRLIVIRDQQDRESLVANLLRHTDLSDFFQQIHDAISIHTRLNSLLVELAGYRVRLEEDRLALRDKRSGLEQLSDEQEHQQYGLIIAKSAKDKVLAETKGQESAYQKQLTDIEKQKAAFFNEMRELELRIVSGGYFIVHIKADSVPPPGTKIFSAPESGYIVTQGYGMTKYARRGAYGGAPHNGYDVAAGYGTPIRSIGPGVIVANGSNKGWGNWVAIQHPNNMVSVYAHMSSFTKKVGTEVTSAMVIGYEGATGKATGSHLHLSLYREFFTYINEATGELYFNYFEGSLNPRSYVNL